MATVSREARRRRIMDRGSDRLALITGQIHTLPSTSSHHTHTASSPPVFFQDRDLQTNLSDQSNVAHCGQDNSASILPENEYSRSIVFGTESKVEPKLRKCETSVETAKVLPLEDGSKHPTSFISSTAQSPTPVSIVDTESRPEPRPSHRFFTLNEISSSITSSESTRIYFSITVALLVVLLQVVKSYFSSQYPHIGFPLLSSKVIKNILTSRPLYLVLVTDATIILARLLLLEKRGVSVKADEQEKRVSLDSGYGWAEGVGKALETGLVLHRAFSAVFMDCSVYAVVLICGLSLVTYLW